MIEAIRKRRAGIYSGLHQDSAVITDIDYLLKRVEELEEKELAKKIRIAWATPHRFGKSLAQARSILELISPQTKEIEITHHATGEMKVLKARIAALRGVLEKIKKNSCCEVCQCSACDAKEGLEADTKGEDR